MKTTGKIVLKLLAICCFLYITPFYNGIQLFLNGATFLDAFVYQQHKIDENISLKNQLNLMAFNDNLTIEDTFHFETTQDTLQKEETKNEEPPTPDEPEKEPVAPPVVEDSGKRVYIYNTHQSEAYVGGQTVMDAAALLGNKLEEKGIHVVLETADFGAYANAKGLSYDQFYQVSYNYMNDALVTYGGFDMIIDFHRDSIPREVSYIQVDGVNYAKMMYVIGGLTKNAEVITETASTLNDIINAKMNGIMRSTMTREAYYNQQVSDKTLLIECGGDVNPFDEVKNSMSILADGIHEYLMR